MQKKLRRQSDMLVMFGTGVLALGAWGVIRAIMNLVVNRKEIESAFAGEAHIAVYTVLFYVITAIMLAIILAAHLFVGLSARSEGLKEKRRYVYLVIAFVMAIVYLYDIITSVAFLDTENDDLFDFLAALMINVTVFITLTRMIIMSIKVKILRKRIKEQECE